MTKYYKITKEEFEVKDPVLDDFINKYLEIMEEEGEYDYIVDDMEIDFYQDLLEIEFSEEDLNKIQSWIDAHRDWVITRYYD